MDDKAELALRMQKLEADLRNIKRISLGLLLIIVVLAAVMISHARTRHALELSELTIKDHSGAVIARLGEYRHGTCLELTTRSGASKATLCADRFYGSNLDLSNENPSTRASLSAGRKLYEGGDRLVPSLFIEGENGENRFSVNVGTDPISFLGHSDSDDALVLSGGRHPAVNGFGAGGKEVWSFEHR